MALGVVHNFCEPLEREISRLKRALQRIADLPPPEHLTRPYKRTPQQIAITALRKRPSSLASPPAREKGKK